MTYNTGKQAAQADAHVSPRASPSLARRRWPAVSAIAFILFIHVVGRVGSFCSPIRGDSYVYAGIGYRIAEGGALYSPQLSDVKPPGLYYIYALFYLFLPPGRISMIPADTLFGLLGYWAIYRLARDLYGRSIAWVLAVVAAIVTNAFLMLDFATDGFGLSEAFMILPAALAAREYVHSMGQPTTTRFFRCGLLLGVLSLMKQTGLALVAAIIVHSAAIALFRSLGAWRNPEPTSDAERPRARHVGGTVSPRSRISFGHSRWRPWVISAGFMAAGAITAVAPFTLLVIAQGHGQRAVRVLGTDAVRMLGLETAWPSQWSDVMPVGVPLAWAALGLAWWIERRCRGHTQLQDKRGTQLNNAVPFLLTWLVAECVLLAFLPLRSFHYYVMPGVALTLSSGIFWVMLSAAREASSARVAFSRVSAAGVLSLAFGRIVVDTMLPIAVARYRSYDAVVDRAYFDELVSRPVLVFGETPRTQATDERPDE